jgi:MarR family transcriptional regulator, organic hydroperoxide resistance regulator
MRHPLSDNVGFRILQVHRAHRNRAEVALAELGLYVGQEMVLFQLWAEEGLAQSQLGEILCVGAATMAKSLSRLERAGLVARRPDAEDARVSRVYLTPQGRALEGQVQAIWAELERLSLQGLSEEEQGSLRRLLERVQANLD